MRKYLHFILIILLSTIYSCEEHFEYNTGAKLSFSCDTLKFDTVFTGQKSSIRFIKIFNHTGKNININSIRLENNDNQIFLNINGRETLSAENIELRKGDSIFVFVQTNLKTGKDNELHTNSLIVNTGGENQRVIITAFGLNIIKLNEIIASDTILASTLPYLAEKSITVEENCKLTIKEGVTIYFNKNCGMNILGSLKIQGSLQKPVVMQGIRTESEYKDVPGQWSGITFGEESQNNLLYYATIINAISGISCTENTVKSGNITIACCKLENHSQFGINLFNTNALIYNTLIDNCGNSCLAIGGNGEYNIMHCTIANYWTYGYRNNAALLCDNLNPDLNGNKIDFKGFIANSIIYGNHYSELDCAMPVMGDGNIKFYNCLIKNNITESPIFNSCVFNLDPQFSETDSTAYCITQESPAKDMANSQLTNTYNYLATDYFGNNRNSDTNPDAGFAEFLEQE